MRRIVLTSLALVATALALPAQPSSAATETPLTVTKLRADWIGSKHQIFIDTTWTPKRFETQVTVKISVNGQRLRTLQVKRWVIGRKLFKLTVPDTVAAGSNARIEVKAHSKAGTDKRTVKLDLP
jgi:hypothetical protein